MRPAHQKGPPMAHTAHPHDSTAVEAQTGNLAYEAEPRRPRPATDASTNAAIVSAASPLRGIHRPRWRDYTAIVLSGGGARGALQVGALKALIEFGERPDVVVGTSIGSWNGAWLAHNPTPESVEALAAVWRMLTSNLVLLGIEPDTPRRHSTAGLRLLVAARRVTRGYPSLYSDAGLRLLVEKYIGDLTFDDVAVPLRIIATDLAYGTRAVFNSGPVAPAIMASSAIPGIFPPVRIGDHAYIDGGALDNCSLETALALGARRIFVIDVDYDDGSGPSPLWCGELTPAALRARGASVHALAAVFARMTQVVCQYQLQRALQRIPRGVEVHRIRPGAGVTGGVMEFERADAWIEHAYAVTRDYLRSRLPQPATPAAS